MIEAYSLFSGSTGNSYLIRDGHTQILIDAGRSCLAIEKSLGALGTSLSKIDAVFITHEHADHTCGLEIISKKFQLPVYMTAPSYDNCVRGGSYLFRLAKRCPVLFKETIGTLCVASFEIPHDSRQNVGYIISSCDDVFGIATDMGHITEAIANNLSGCNKIILESNHDIKMLNEGPYPRFLKDRILSAKGHLSNESCGELAAYLCDKGVKEITLAHLSRENNLPSLAYETTRACLDKYGFENVILKVAMPEITVCATDGKDYKNLWKG